MSSVDGNGGSTSFVYSRNDAQTTVGPAPSGEHLKQTQVEYDGLGRVKSTCSLETSGGTSCGQAMGGSGVLTSNTYSFGSGSSTVVTARGVQSRTVVKDALGRITSKTNPETGTTSYLYDSVNDGVCTSTSQGDIVETRYTSGTILCMYYDKMHRLSDVGSNIAGAECRRFRYDNQNVTGTIPSGISVANTLGRMEEAETDNCSVPYTPMTDEWFSYDANGRVTGVYEMTPHSGGYYHTTAVYYKNGQLQTLSGIPGYTAYSFGLDGNGRANTMSQGSTTFINGVQRNAAGEPTAVNVSTAGDQDTYAYDPNTGRMTSYTFTVNGKTDTGVLQWNPSGTVRQLSITDTFNSGGSQVCIFTYDDLARLITDNCGSSLWSQTYSYDDYDNLTKTGNPGTSWIPGYNAANNRYLSIGAIYDGDGRLQYDSINTYGWSPYGKMASVRAGTSAATCGSSGTCLTYDALGRMVEKSVNATYSEILYSPIGRTSIMSGASTVTSSQIPLPGGLSAYVTGSGGTGTRGINHVDWLGSVRLQTTLSARAKVFDTAYTPYGENYDSFGTVQPADFTGDLQDIVAGLFDTPNRELAQTQDRWLSPDPAGHGWNLYAYPTDPNRNVDPTGLYPARMFASMWGCMWCGIRPPTFSEQDDDPDGLHAKLIAYRAQNQQTIKGVPAECQGCTSEKKAAIAAEKYAVGQTRAAAKKNRYEEFGGWVITKDGKTFTYTRPVTFGEDSNFYPGKVTVPEGYAEVASYHTHPDPGSWGEGFSARDMAWANRNQMDIYVGISYSGNCAPICAWQNTGQWSQWGIR